MTRLKKLFRFAVVILCGLYLLRFFYTNKDSLEIAFSLKLTSILSLLALILLYCLLNSYRFQLVLEKCSTKKLPFFPWFRIFILGRFLNTFFPQVGNIYRSIRVKKDYNISYTGYISAFTSFAWMDTCINLTIAAFVVLFLSPNLKIGRFPASKTILLLVAVVAGAPVLTEIFLRRINFHNKHLAWTKSKLSEVLTISVQNLKDGPYLIKVLLSALLVFVCAAAIFHICFLSFDTPLSLPTLALFYVLFKLSTYVNLTPGNLGIQELAYGLLSQQLGTGMAQGVLISMIIRIMGTCVVIAFGLAFGGLELLRHRKDYVNLAE